MKPEEMFVLFLQKIEQSDGFSNFTKINNVTHNYKTTTIIPPNFEAKFEMMNYEKEEKEKQNQNQNNSQIEKEEKIDIYKKLDAYEPKYINYINETYGKDLLNLYKTIVSFGDQFNFQYMKSKAFLKFLVESNLVKDKNHNFGLKLNDIDIFFIKMCLLMKNNEQNLNNNINIIHTSKYNNSTVNVSYGEIDYPTFIISIEILSRLLFNDLPIKQAIDTLVVDYILNNKEMNNSKINEIEEKIDNLKELQNSQDMIELLQVVHKAFYPLFIYYTKENEGLMSNKNFMKFTKDFEIFPYLIGKAKLNYFFYGISQYSMYGQNDNALIEHSLFVDLIALMALEMNYPNPEPSPVEKILIFIEKISQSQGPGKIILNTGSNRQGNCGNFLEYFKEVYPGYFNAEQSEKEDFSSIMQNDDEEGEENNEKNNDKGESSRNENNLNENNINENNINENEYENEKNENNSKKEDGSKEDINSQIEKKSSESNNNASNNSEKKEDIKKSSVILDKEKDNQFQVNISGSVGSGNINILKNQPPKNFEDLTKLPNDNESLKNIHDQSNVKVTIENDIKVPDIIVPKNEDINNNLSPNDNPTDTLKNQFDIKPIDQGNLKINIGEQNNNNNINIDGSNILPQINVNQKIDLEDRFSQVHTEEKDGKFTMSGIIKGIKKDVKIDLPNANINNVNNQNININGNITGVNVNGPKVDLNGPKVNIKESYLSGIIQGTNVKEHSINIPSGNINVKKPEFKNNLDINPPKIKGSNFVGNNSNDLEFKIPSAKVDINGPKINSPNININGNGPDFNVKAPETDIKINKLSKDFNLSGIIPGYKPGNVNLQGPNIKSPNINIEGKSKDININPKMNLPSLGGDIKLNNDFNIKGPTIDKNQDFIGINFNNPSINKEINIKGNPPGINIDGQKMPNLKLNGNLDGELPNINGPDIDGKTANLNINPPQVKKIPDFNAKGPGLDMNKNNCDFYISGIVPGNPNPKMNSININGNMTGINVNSQKYDINGNMPGINVNAPYINLKGSKPNINGSNNLSGIIAGKNVKGSNINMSSGNININGPEINKSGNININAQKFEGPNVDLNIKGNKMNMPNTILPDSSLNGKLDGNINIKGGNTNINGNLPGINVKGSKIDINNNIINSNASIVSSSYNFLLSGIIPSKNDKNRQVQILQSKGPGNISVKGPSINVNNNSKIKFHGNIDDNNLGIDMNNLKGSRALKINNDSTNFNLGKHYLDINNNNNIGGLNNGNEELEGSLPSFLLSLRILCRIKK